MQRISFPKTLVCITVILALIFSSLVFSSADEQGAEKVWGGEAEAVLSGKGTLDSPYMIATAEDLAYVVKSGGQTDGYYKLTSDIYLNDISKINWSTGEAADGYLPNQWFTEETATAFKGHINGDGHVIYGLYITEVSDGKCAGLIPKLAKGGSLTVEKLGIDCAYLASDSSAKMAVFTGHANDASGATYKECFTGANTTVKTGTAGVFSAYNGSAVCNIIDCYSETVVAGKNHTGLIANIWSFKSSTIKNLYSTSGIYLSAKHDSGLAEAYLTYKDTLYFGGFTPDSDGNVSGGKYYQANYFAGTDNMKGFDALKGSDKMSKLGDSFLAANTYPILKAFADRDDMIARRIWKGNVADGLSGAGTEADPFIISTPDELAFAVKNGGKINSSGDIFKLTADIYLNDISKVDWATGGSDADYVPNQWYNSSTVSKNFIGNIDGDGHTVFGLYCTGFGDGSNASYGALIPYVSSENVNASYKVSVKNLKLDCAYIASDKNKSYGSAFIGYTQNSPSNIIFEKCGAGDEVFVRTDMPSVFFAHGAPNTTFKNCYSRATVEDVSGAVAGGGFIGHTWSSNSATATVSSVYSTVSIYDYKNYPSPWNGLTDAQIGSFYYHRATKQWYIPKASYIASLDNMKGTDALTNSAKMPRLDKTAFYATEEYPELKVFADNVTVTFDANGGSFADGEMTLVSTERVGSDFSLSAPIPSGTDSENGLVFAGWSFYPTQTSVAERVSSHMDGATIYAVYKKPITVTLDANGGLFGTESSITLTQYVGLDLSAEVPENGAAGFLGWSSDRNSATLFTDKITENMDGTTLYAVWKTGPHVGDYKTFDRTVDYSDYTVDDFNSYGGNFTKVPDETADGGAYLKLKVTSDAGAWLPNYNLVMTENGDIGEGLVLPAKTTFRITLRVRGHELSSSSAILYSIYGYDRFDKWSITTANDNANSAYSQYGVIRSAIELKDDWTEIESIFTTPDSYLSDSSGNLYNQCYVGLTIGGGKAFEYDIDSIRLEKVTAVNFYLDKEKTELFDTLYGQPGTAFTLPETAAKEIYTEGTAGYTEEYRFEGWSTDDYDGDLICKFGNSNVSLYCGTFTKIKASDVNLEGFCGFDLYKPVTEGVSFDPDKVSVTDEIAFTGKNSLKFSDTAVAELRNDKTFEVLNGKTYYIELYCKGAEGATVELGVSSVSDITAAFQPLDVKKTEGTAWEKLAFMLTPEISQKEGKVFAVRVTAEDAPTYIDTVTVSSVTESVGAYKQNGELRLMFSYNGVESVELCGKNYDISERGILVKGGENPAKLTLDHQNANGVFRFSVSDLKNAYSYNTVSGDTVYSVKLDGFEKEDDYAVSARGYVRLANGEVFYSDVNTVSVITASEYPDLFEKADDLSDYCVYLPEGTEIKGFDSFNASCYDANFNELSDTVQNDVLKQGCYLKSETLIPDSVITLPAELLNTVHAGKRSELYYGVESNVIKSNLKNSADSVNYIFITDIHYDATTSAAQKTALLNQLKLIKNMANDPDNNIDFVVVGGDTTTGLYGTKQGHIDAIGEILSPLKDCKVPVFTLMGNHDDNSYHAELSSYGKKYLPELILSDKDWKEDVLSLSDFSEGFVHDSERPYSKYYYYDLPGKKTRVVCLDASDYNAPFDGDGNITELPLLSASASSDQEKYATANSFKGFSDRQIDWLVSEALTATEDWDYIFFSHMGIDGETNSYSPVNSDKLRAVISDVQSGQGAKIRSFQFGHMHLELCHYSEDIDLWQISSASANVEQVKITDKTAFDKNTSINNKALPWNYFPRAIGTAGEAAFDVISVTENFVNKQAVGNGQDVKLIYP